LQMAKEMAQYIGQVKYPHGQAVGRSDYTFECTGVESCVQASIYVRPSSSPFQSPE
jgi:L-iditol 2-dehydrogenase